MFYCFGHQGSLMQRVTNMENLKLSFWNPTKKMMDLLKDIKAFLQKHARYYKQPSLKTCVFTYWSHACFRDVRLDTVSERNNRQKYPGGSYAPIEQDLLRLALVSEVNPRANNKYKMNCTQQCPPRAQAQAQSNSSTTPKESDVSFEPTTFDIFTHNFSPPLEKWDVSKAAVWEHENTQTNASQSPR